MIRSSLFLCLLLLGIFSTGCARQASPPVSEDNGVSITSLEVATIPAATPTFDFPTSEAELTTLKGGLLVVSPNVMLPGEEDSIFLVPLEGQESVISIPQFEVGKVPQAVVDETTGLFVFTNIQPGTYAVVVESAGKSQVPARYYDKEGVAIVKVTEADKNKMIDLGLLRFP